MTDAATAQHSTGRSYGGLVTAFPYSFRASDSRVFRAYAFVAGSLGLLLILLYGMTLTVWFFSTLGQSAIVTISNAFLGVVALFVLGPLFAPVLLVARHHRRGDADAGYDFRMALAGFLFVASLYVGLVISVPPDQQQPVSGLFGSIAEQFYALPQAVGVVAPLLAAMLIFAIDRSS